MKADLSDYERARTALLPPLVGEGQGASHATKAASGFARRLGETEGH